MSSQLDFDRAAASGLSLPIIAKLLGHTKVVTTERYAHLAADPIRAANNVIASRISDALQSGSRGRAATKAFGRIR
jgi:hypothetical protein